MIYSPTNWYWIVAGDDARAWSSAASAYVTDYPRDAVTRIDSEQNLSDVLRPHGLTGPYVSTDDYAASVQSHIDAVAKARGYADGVALAGYLSSTIPAWASEAATFIAWRDAIWLHCYTQLANVQSGQRTAPSVAEFNAELPTIVWP